MPWGARTAALILVSAMALAAAAAATAETSSTVELGSDPYSSDNFAMSYFPTGDEDDGRFLHVAGNNLETLANEKIVAYIGVPRTFASFCVGIFDGDTGGMWDIGTDSPDTLLYTLYADAMRDGSGTRVAATWTSAGMADDAWTEFCRPVDADAQAPSKHYFYRLEVGWQSPASADDLNGFKIRSDGEVAIAIQKFGFIAAPLNLGLDPAVLTGDPDPSVNNPDANSYDGTWSFHAYIPSPDTSVTFRDGDADRGDDTDDPDTANTDPDGPGPALAEGSRRGSPADDTSPFPTAAIAGSIAMSVVGPDSATWVNDNPSGNREWELFTISHADGRTLTGGFYELKVTGMDGHNAVYIEPPGDMYAQQRTPLPVLNSPPVADAGSDRASDRLSDVMFDGSGSRDPDGMIVSYQWDFGDGTGASGATVAKRYSAVGTFTATLTVTDDGGATSSDTTSVSVANILPTAEAGSDVSGTVMVDLRFDGGLSTDADGSIASYTWEFGDGSAGAGQDASHRYSSIGQFIVTLTVVDNDGGIDRDTTFANIVNLPPVADAGSDRGTDVNVATTFYGFNSYDPDGMIVSHVWDFGDGTSSNGAAVSHTWTTPGSYVVTLTVTDNFGAMDTDTAVVSVQGPSPVAPVSGTEQGENGFAAVGSDTEGGAPQAPVDLTSGPGSLGPLMGLLAGLGAAAMAIGQGLVRPRLK